VRAESQLNSFNVEVGKLLQVYRRLKDTGGKGPVGLKAFWRQMDLVKDQFETTRSLVARESLVDVTNMLID
jgi:hypothetical protein